MGSALFKINQIRFWAGFNPLEVVRNMQIVFAIVPVTLFGKYNNKNKLQK